MPENGPQQPQAPMAPPPAPQAPQPPQPGMPNPYGQPPKKNTGLIVGIIIGVALLLAGVATALIILLSKDDGDTKKKDDTKSSSKQEDKKKDEDTTANDDKKRAANAKTAQYMSDLSTVCEVGSITNAADFTKPYKVAAFSKSAERNSWSAISLKYNAPYTVKYDEFTQANVVACLSEKDDARVKTKTCDFKSGGEAVSIDYYATTYNVTLYEAKSGKKIKDAGTVNAPASTCPMFASYSKSDPKIIASPDTAAVDAVIAEFAS